VIHFGGENNNYKSHNYLPTTTKLGETVYYAKLNWRLPALFEPTAAILSMVLNTKLVNKKGQIGLCLLAGEAQFQHLF
jgi:hypothetical protein